MAVRYQNSMLNLMGDPENRGRNTVRRWPDSVQGDGGQSDGKFTDPLHMTRAVKKITVMGIGGIIRP